MTYFVRFNIIFHSLSLSSPFFLSVTFVLILLRDFSLSFRPTWWLLVFFFFARGRNAVWQNGSYVSQTSSYPTFGLSCVLKLQTPGLYELAHRSLSVLTISFPSSLSITFRHFPSCLSISLTSRLLTSFCLSFCLPPPPFIAAYALLYQQFFAHKTSYESAFGPVQLSPYSDSLRAGWSMGIESRWWWRDFPQPSRPVLGPTQPPITRGTGSVSRG